MEEGDIVIFVGIILIVSVGTLLGSYLIAIDSTSTSITMVVTEKWQSCDGKFYYINGTQGVHQIYGPAFYTTRVSDRITFDTIPLNQEIVVRMDGNNIWDFKSNPCNYKNKNCNCGCTP
jgi:hypothetical protein